MKTINHNSKLDATEYYLQYSNCLRRKYSACLFNKDDQFICGGSNHSPSGTESCESLGFCVRNKLHIPRGKNYEICKSIHAEQEVIIKSNPEDLNGGVLYLVGKESDGSYVKDAEPCFICKKLIIESGIRKVVVRINRNDYKIIETNSWIKNGLIDNCLDTYSK